MQWLYLSMNIGNYFNCSYHTAFSLSGSIIKLTPLKIQLIEGRGTLNTKRHFTNELI